MSSVVSVTLKYIHKGKVRKEEYTLDDYDTKTISDLCYRLEELRTKEINE